MFLLGFQIPVNKHLLDQFVDLFVWHSGDGENVAEATVKAASADGIGHESDSRQPLAAARSALNHG